jgi:hypothetical protein
MILITLHTDKPTVCRLQIFVSILLQRIPEIRDNETSLHAVWFLPQTARRPSSDTLPNSTGPGAPRTSQSRGNCEKLRRMIPSLTRNMRRNRVPMPSLFRPTVRIATERLLAVRSNVAGACANDCKIPYNADLDVLCRQVVYWDRSRGKLKWKLALGEDGVPPENLRRRGT